MAVLDIMAYDGRWFVRMCLIDGRDGLGRVPCPGCRVNHAFPCLLVITVLLCYLLHLHTKLNSRDVMVIIVPEKVSHCDIRSLSNVHNWTSHDEMPCAATLLAVLSGMG